MASAAVQRLHDFKLQNIANTAWAFATVSHPDAQLFTALARVAEPRMGDFEPQGLANTT